MHKHTHKHKYMHETMHVHVDACVVCVCVCVHLFCARVHAHTHTRAQTHASTNTRVCLHARGDACVVCVFAHVRAYTHTHSHKWTPVKLLKYWHTVYWKISRVCCLYWHECWSVRLRPSHVQSRSREPTSAAWRGYCTLNTSSPSSSSLSLHDDQN